MSSPILPSGVIPTYAQQYRRCGKPTCSACADGGRGHGPYWYAYWREGGRMHSRYLGKQVPLTMTAARQALLATVGSPPALQSHTDMEFWPCLRVRTLGDFMVWRGAEPVPAGRWRRRKVADLFKLLLGAPAHRLHREHISDQLWPEAGPEAGANSLRSTVYLLRALLDRGVPGVRPPETAGSQGARRSSDRTAHRSYLRSDGDALTLCPAPMLADGEEPPLNWLDAAAFTRAAAAALASDDAAACREALALYGGDYLPDDVYSDWTSARRLELRSDHQALMLHLSALCGARGELAEAEQQLHAVLAADPCREEAAQRLMALLAADERHGEAARVYHALEAALRDDLALAPAPETTDLYQRLLRRRTLPVAAPSPTPTGAAAVGLTNLSLPISSFVGRQQDQAAIKDLLDAHRLLTLTGAGGCGKTRLAQQVALDRQTVYPDGVWLVELAAQTDPALVAATVARALGLSEDVTAPSQQVLAAVTAPEDKTVALLVAFLRPRRLLLLLDNCEHLLGACASLANTLLSACPHLRILSTSREPLGVAGEAVWRVPSLPFPTASDAPNPEALLRYDAIMLFVQRARLVRPDFALTAENAPAVAQVCRRLDGIPLAIEFAAARLGMMSPHGLAARLDDRFRVLVGGSPTTLPRQRTLRATMDWSYVLLDAQEQAVLRAFAVFAGGWTLQAAAAVCARDDVRAEAVAGLLEQLLRKSLLAAMAPDRDGDPRFGLLETVRQYARERLDAAGETPAVRRRHLDYYLTLARNVVAGWTDTMLGTWLVRLDEECDNLRAALDCAREDADIARGLELCVALARYWEMRGQLSEGRAWLDEFLARAGGASAALRATALNAAGNLANRQGDRARATALLEEALALKRDLGDARGMAMLLNNLGYVEDESGHYARAAALHEESLALKRVLGDQRGVAYSLTNLGRVAHHRGDLARAATLHDQSVTLLRGLGDRHNLARALNNLAEVVQAQGDDARAADLLEESLALKRELGDRQGIAASLILLGALAARGHDDRRAAQLFQESLALSRELGDQRGIDAALRELSVGRRGASHTPRP